ncbi:MAG: M12 family metallo-peptidase [Gemmatimonadota bacterium]|nr:M12 family metallo-peptidase [Gemmatimonadota bacterium]
MNNKTVIHLATCFFASVCLHSVSTASTPEADSVHFCQPFDYEAWRRDHPLPAAKRPADLNVGEPRTVRLIYFLPNDRPYRAEVVKDMKDRIREVQAFYAVSMGERGYDDTTFQFETDGAGEPLVHRVNAQYLDSHYLDETFVKVLSEIEQAFDTEQNVYIVVIDISTNLIERGAAGKGTRIGKIGGFALVTSDEMDPWNYHNVVSHELGHTFGLRHDFRHSEYVMSYGNLPDSRLSMCNAGFLAAHPYFDANSPSESGQPPSIELISPLTYPAGAKEVAVQLEVNDPDGLHQVILHVPNSVKACSVLAG